MSIIYISTPLWLETKSCLSDIQKDHDEITIWTDQRIQERKYQDVLTYPQELLLFCGLQREKWYYTHTSRNEWFVSPSGFLDYLAFHGYNPHIVQDLDLREKVNYLIVQPYSEEWYLSQPFEKFSSYWKYYEPYFPGIHHPRMTNFIEKQLQFLYRKDIDMYDRLMEMLKLIQWNVNIYDVAGSYVPWQIWIKNHIHNLLTR